jgi:multidrug efflux pump subunit AcrA (membrane-fusion protein)
MYQELLVKKQEIDLQKSQITANVAQAEIVSESKLTETTARYKQLEEQYTASFAEAERLKAQYEAMLATQKTYQEQMQARMQAQMNAQAAAYQQQSQAINQQFLAKKESILTEIDQKLHEFTSGIQNRVSSVNLEPIDKSIQKTLSELQTLRNSIAGSVDVGSLTASLTEAKRQIDELTAEVTKTKGTITEAIVSTFARLHKI